MAGQMVEIRWHARGGQGAKTAAIFLAEAVLDKGMYGQGFPEYGPDIIQTHGNRRIFIGSAGWPAGRSVGVVSVVAAVGLPNSLHARLPSSCVLKKPLSLTELLLMLISVR